MQDNLFIRGKVPMTKEEVRTIVLSKLDLQNGEVFMDVGAGTGSVSIEAALKMPKGKVIAIEQKDEAIELIHKNKEKFEVSNLTVFQGKAPEHMNNLPEVNKYFIGGSGGNLEDILSLIHQNAPKQSVLVVTAIVLDTMYKTYRFFKDNNIEFELIQVAVNKVDTTRKIAMLEAQNPIFILTAKLNNKSSEFGD